MDRALGGVPSARRVLGGRARDDGGDPVQAEEAGEEAFPPRRVHPRGPGARQDEDAVEQSPARARAACGCPADPNRLTVPAAWL